VKYRSKILIDATELGDISKMCGVKYDIGMNSRHETGERAEAIKVAKQKTLSFLWFIRNELGYKTLALAGDEFSTADSLPFIPYHRESGRIHCLILVSIRFLHSACRWALPFLRGWMD
jgi:hypothetical protein